MQNKKHFSYTATFIIIKLFGLSKNLRFYKLVDEQAGRYYEGVVKSVPFPLYLFRTLLKIRPLRDFATFMEDRVIPGDLMHLLMRKAYMLDQINRAMDDGFRQVVVLGSGLDFSAIRTSLMGIPSFEVDEPDTIELKKNLVSDLHYTNPNLHFAAVNILDDGLFNGLRNVKEFQPGIPTLFIAEGFLDYQKLDTVEQIFHDMDAITEHNTRFLFTLFDFSEMPPLHAQIIKDSVSFVGEYLGDNIGRNRIEELLNRNNLRLNWYVDPEKMKQEKMIPLGIFNPLFYGFYIMTADSA